MSSKFGRLGVLAVAITGVVGSGMSPVHASTSGTALFQGAMTTGPLGYPCTPVGTTISCLPLPDKWGQPTVGATFSSFTCVGEKTDVKPSGKGVRTYGPECQMRAQGIITGYCGLMLGILQVTITWFPTETKTVNATLTFKDFGGTAVVNGTTEKGIISGVWEITPDPRRGSCTAGTQTEFIVTGSVTLTGITVLPS